jgi:multiple sugar transport system substrate-binding protein
MSSSIRNSNRRSRHRGRRLLALATAAAALALTACSSGGSSTAASTGKVTLTFWSWVPGISQSVNLWNKSHPDIQVSLDETTSGGAGTYAKMFSALQAGNAPDLGQCRRPGRST